MPRRKPIATQSIPAHQSIGGEDEMSNDLSKYVTTKQAAERLGVVLDHVYRLIDGDKIKCIRLGHEWLIFAPSLEKYLQTKSKRGRPPSRASRFVEIK